MKYEDLIFSLKKRFPKFQIKKKADSNLLSAISWFLFLVTFGKFKRNDFLNEFVTTIGYTVYVGDNWDSFIEPDKISVLIHESKHLEQYKNESFWFAFKYLFLPFPIGFANFRLNYEAEAYAQAIVHDRLKSNSFLYGRAYEDAVKFLSGPQYFWPTFSKDKVRRILKRKIFENLREKWKQ